MGHLWYSQWMDQHPRTTDIVYRKSRTSPSHTQSTGQNGKALDRALPCWLISLLCHERPYSSSWVTTTNKRTKFQLLIHRVFWFFRSEKLNSKRMISFNGYYVPSKRSRVWLHEVHVTNAFTQHSKITDNHRCRICMLKIANNNYTFDKINKKQTIGTKVMQRPITWAADNTAQVAFNKSPNQMTFKFRPH